MNTFTQSSANAASAGAGASDDGYNINLGNFTGLTGSAIYILQPNARQKNPLDANLNSHAEIEMTD